MRTALTVLAAIVIGTAAQAADIEVAMGSETVPDAAVADVQAWLATPAVARAFPVEAVAPGWAVVLLISALILSARESSVWSVRTGILGAVGLVFFGVRNLDVLNNPVLPSAMADSVERLAVTAALWLGLSVMALLASLVLRRSGADLVSG